MGGLYQLGAIVRLVDMFTGPAARMAASTKGLVRELHLVDKALKLVKVSMATLGIAAVLALPLAGGAQAAGNFETGLTRLGLISQATAGQMAQLRGEALKLGVLTEWSPREATAGMTALASAGYQVREQLAGINTILNFSTASQGILDLATSVRITDSVLKTYGMRMKDASTVTDKLCRLTQLATVGYQDLATAIPVVSAAGAAANQTLSDTLALLGAIRPAAQSTQDAAQIFNSFAQAIKAPTRRMKKYVQSEFGIDLNQLFRADGGTGDLLSMIQIVENLQKAMVGLNKAQQQEFLQRSLSATGAKAYNAILQMTHDTMVDGRLVTLKGVDAVRAMSAKLDGATGTTKKFAAEMMQTWDGVKKMIAGTLETFAIVLGMGPLKVIKALISSITGLLNPILAWMQRHERLTTILGASATVIVGLAAALALLGLSLGLTTLLAAKMSLGLKALSLTALKGRFLALAAGVRSFSLALLGSPITWIVLAVIALAAAVVWAYHRFQGFRDLVDALGARLRSLAAGVWAGLVMVFKAVVKQLEPVIAAFGRLFDWLGLTGTKGDNATKIFGKWVDVGIKVGKVLSGVILVGLGLVIAKVAVLTAVMLANPITWVVLGIVAAIAAVVAIIENWGAITDWLSAKWAAVATFFKNLWTQIKAAFKVGLEWIKHLFLTYHPVGIIYSHWGQIVDWFSGLWARVTAVFVKVWETIKHLFLTYHPVGLVISHWDQIVAFFSGLWDRVLATFDQAWQRITGFFSGHSLADAGRALWDTFVSGLESIIDKPMEVVKKGLTKLRKLLPFSDAKEGPLSSLTASGKAIPKTLAVGLQAAAPVLHSAAAGALAGLGLGKDRGEAPKLRVDLASVKDRLAAAPQAQAAPAPAQGPAGKGDRPVSINNLTIKVDGSDLTTLKDLVELLQGLGVEGVPA